MTVALRKRSIGQVWRNRQAVARWETVAGARVEAASGRIREEVGKRPSWRIAGTAAWKSGSTASSSGISSMHHRTVVWSFVYCLCMWCCTVHTAQLWQNLPVWMKILYAERVYAFLCSSYFLLSSMCFRHFDPFLLCFISWPGIYHTYVQIYIAPKVVKTNLRYLKTNINTATANIFGWMFLA